MADGKKFAVFDIDGTLIRWQLYHAIADNLVKLGFIAPAKYQAIKDARMVWKRRESSESFKKYESQLVVVYEQILSEITVEQFELAAQEVFEEYKDQVYTYTRDLIKKLKKEGYLLFAISGSQTEVVEKVAKYYSFDDFVGTVYARKGKSFTGQSTYYAADKRAVLDRLIDKHRVSLAGSIAVGDSLGDKPMLEMVERPIAFNPERKLFSYARRKGWKVVVERKNMVYELEKRDGKYQLVKTN